MEIKTIHSANFSMDYFHFGHGEKTLVILPGLSVQSVMGAADAIAEAYRPIEDKFTVYVFDRILRNGVLKRTVIERGKVIGIEEISEDDSNVTGYNFTINAYPDANGNTSKDYYLKPATTSQTEDPGEG